MEGERGVKGRKEGRERGGLREGRKGEREEVKEREGGRGG